MNKVNNFGVKILAFLRGDSVKGGTNKFKGSIFAIIIGLILALAPLMVDVFTRNASISKFYEGLFIKPFDKVSLKDTFMYISVFMIVGGGIGVSFKTGLFNIGASGQMLAAGGTAVIFAILMPKNVSNALPRELWIFILIIVSALIGALVAGIAGILKAYGNVHEVVSTIMLNWIIYYIFKEVIGMDAIRNPHTTSSSIVGPDFAFSMIRLFKYDYIAVFAIAIILMVSVFLIFKYTKFGFSMRMNGLNTEGAKYAGINNKLTTIYSMMLSGALAGIGGYIYYMTIKKQIPDATSLDNAGFESITVALLSFSSPIGAIFAGFFYGVIYNGSQLASSYAVVTKETFGLIVGLIIFSASIAPRLVDVKPIVWFRNWLISIRNRDIKELKTKYKNDVKNSWYQYKLNLWRYNAEQRLAKSKYKKFIKFSDTELSFDITFEKAKEFNCHEVIKHHLMKWYNEEINKINSTYKNKGSLELFFEKDRVAKDLALQLEALNVNKGQIIKTNFNSTKDSLKRTYLLEKTTIINQITTKQLNSVEKWFAHMGEAKPIIRLRLWTFSIHNKDIKNIYAQYKNDKKELRNNYKNELSKVNIQNLSDEEIEVIKSNYKTNINKLNVQFYAIRNAVLKENNENLWSQLPLSQIVEEAK